MSSCTPPPMEDGHPIPNVPIVPVDPVQGMSHALQVCLAHHPDMVQVNAALHELFSRPGVISFIAGCGNAALVAKACTATAYLTDVAERAAVTIGLVPLPTCLMLAGSGDGLSIGYAALAAARLPAGEDGLRLVTDLLPPDTACATVGDCGDALAIGMAAFAVARLPPGEQTTRMVSRLLRLDTAGVAIAGCDNADALSWSLSAAALLPSGPHRDTLLSSLLSGPVCAALARSGIVRAVARSLAAAMALSSREVCADRVRLLLTPIACAAAKAEFTGSWSAPLPRWIDRFVAAVECLPPGERVPLWIALGMPEYMAWCRESAAARGSLVPHSAAGLAGAGREARGADRAK